jgi:hypothetical protein
MKYEEVYWVSFALGIAGIFWESITFIVMLFYLFYITLHIRASRQSGNFSKGCKKAIIGTIIYLLTYGTGQILINKFSSNIK